MNSEEGKEIFIRKIRKLYKNKSNPTYGSIGVTIPSPISSKYLNKVVKIFESGNKCIVICQEGCD